MWDTAHNYQKEGSGKSDSEDKEQDKPRDLR